MADLLLKIDKTLRHHGRSALRAARGAWWDLTRPPADRPVIVLGCSRAGTTVVYKTLSESPQLGTLQRETHDFWVDLHPVENKGWNTHALDAGDASARDRDFVARYFYAWTGRSRWVDKNNQNGLCVPYLQALFPDAVFVYVKRGPGDNINSLIEGWGKPDKWKEGRNRERVERVMERLAPWPGKWGTTSDGMVAMGRARPPGPARLLAADPAGVRPPGPGRLARTGPSPPRAHHRKRRLGPRPIMRPRSGA